MRAQTIFRMIVFCLAALMTSGGMVMAQSGGDFAIVWSTYGDGGAGTSADGDFTVDGTIGQLDAGEQLSSGGPFGHRNGYWVFITTGTTTITIYCYKDGNDVRIEWVPLPTFALYDIYYGTDKDRKLFTPLDLGQPGMPYYHVGALTDPDDFYYSVVPSPWKK